MTASLLAQWIPQHAFAWWALTASALVGVACALAGVAVTLRRNALLGDTIGHAALPGVVASWLATGRMDVPTLLVGALLSAGAAVWLVEMLSKQRHSRPETAVAAVTAGSYGVGVLLLGIAQRSASSSAQLESFLLGNAAAATQQDVVALSLALLLVVAGGVAGWRVLVLHSFDPLWATSTLGGGRRLRIGLTIVLALVVVLSVRIVGVLLVSAMLLMPAAIGLILRLRLPYVVASSALAGLVCGVVGDLASYRYPGISTGPAMVLTGACLLSLAAVLARVAARADAARPRVDLVVGGV